MMFVIVFKDCTVQTSRTIRWSPLYFTSTIHYCSDMLISLLNMYSTMWCPLPCLQSAHHFLMQERTLLSALWVSKLLKKPVWQLSAWQVQLFRDGKIWNMNHLIFWTVFNSNLITIYDIPFKNCLPSFVTDKTSKVATVKCSFPIKSRTIAYLTNSNIFEQ